jgi:hypothetical protein
MENYISDNLFVHVKVDSEMGNKVPRAILFSPDPVLLSVNKLLPDRMILLIDRKPSPQQEYFLKFIQNSLGEELFGVRVNG